MERPDVILLENSAAIPFIQDGWCLVPECKRYFAAIYHYERIDEAFTPGGGPKPRPGYCLSTEVTSIEEFRKRDEEDDELEARLREAAQKDERADITQLEVAGTVVTLTQREAALVVHCTEEWAGTKIKTRNDWGVWHRNRQKTIFTLAANLVGRPAGGGIVYAAVFPRIRPVSYIGWHEGVRTATCAISADREEVRYQDSYELSLGNVTEIDWTTPPTPERRPPLTSALR